MSGETISPEDAANLVKSGMWLDYGASLCQPDVFDRALAARKDEPTNVKIRSCLSLRPRAVIENDPEGKQYHMFRLALFRLRPQETRRRALQLCAVEPGRGAGLLPALSRSCGHRHPQNLP